MKIDMHTHSINSDGTKTPMELAKEAKELNLEMFCITDHNKCAYYEQIEEIYSKVGIRIIPSIELTVATDPSIQTPRAQMHILGYGIKDIEKLREKLNYIKQQNDKECIKSLDKMVQDSIGITYEDVLRNSAIGKITRGSIMRALVENEIVKDLEEAKEVLKQHPKYSINKIAMSYKEGINLLKEVGALVILAHPYRPKFANLEESILQLKALGIDGIEVFYKPYTMQRIEELNQIATKYNLLKTGGTDCHSKKKRLTLGVEAADLEIVKLLKN
ncbi:MAG: PHP domain-containing protein [Clostridia bacterium]